MGLLFPFSLFLSFYLFPFSLFPFFSFLFFSFSLFLFSLFLFSHVLFFTFPIFLLFFPFFPFFSFSLSFFQHLRALSTDCHLTPFFNWGQISSLSFRRPPNYLEELLQTFAEGKLQRTLNPTMLLVLQHCGQLFRNIQCDLPLCVL